MDDTPVTVAGVERAGPDAVALTLETPPGFDAQPGQFVKFTTTLDGEQVSRFYSISSPTVADTFELTVGIDPEGEVSPQLRDLSPGSTVRLSGPYGSAHYEGETRVLVLAGGPGIGPAVGIAERVLGEGGDAGVVYRDDSPLHRDRLDALDDRGGAVVVLEAGGPLAAGIERVGLDDRQVFVYGFADFLDDATAAIAAAGGEPGRAKVENFG